MNGRLFSNIVDRMHRDLFLFCSGELKEMGLTVGLMYFVIFVAKNPGATPTELGEALGLDKGYVLRCLKKLVADGFIERREHPTDGRASLLYPSGKGKEVYRLSLSMLERWDESRLKALSDEEKETLFALLSKIETKGRKTE